MTGSAGQPAPHQPVSSQAARGDAYGPTGQNPTPPFAPGQYPGAQYPGGQYPTAQYPAGQPGYPYAAEPEPPRRNVVGIIALVCAVLGFIFACIPGALMLGWILLPIAFILGLVGVFMKGRKWPAVAAIILSIVGTIVGAAVFIFVVGKAFDDSFNSDVTVSQGGEGAAPNGSASPEEGKGNNPGDTRANPLPVGSTVESDEWAVTLNSVDLNATDAVLAENPFNEAPGADQTYALVNVTLAYKGDDPQGSTPMEIVSFVLPDGTTVNSYDTSAVAPEALDSLTTLYSGATVTGNVDFVVPAATAGEGVISIQPDPFSKKKFFAVK